jgi:hypothetical protein
MADQAGTMATDDVVILSAARTPVGRLAGALADVPAARLGATAIGAALERAGIRDSTEIDEVYMGNVVSAGLGQNIARQCAILGGVLSKGEAVEQSPRRSVMLTNCETALMLPIVYAQLLTDYPDEAAIRAALARAHTQLGAVLEGLGDLSGALENERRALTFDDGIAVTKVTKGFGVQGAFKIPSLRNVALTAPYFHNGDALTLRQVVELYSRGGNVAPLTELDGTPIEPLGVPILTADEIDAVVAFLEALTDERVLYRRAPFDHPQLFVPNGHPGGSTATIDANGDGLADDLMIEIPAVGAAGGPPLPGFLEGVFGAVARQP